MSKPASEKMIIDAIGPESPEDPFATDEETEYSDSKQSDKKNDNDDEQSRETKKSEKKKRSLKRKPSDSSKIVKKNKSELKKDLKMKLAGIVKEEDLIYNTNNKLHSNASAISAAWQRIAKKMDQSGK